MILELIGLSLFIGSFGIVGFVLLNMCAVKNQEVTERIFNDVLIGMIAGGVVALLTSISNEGIFDNWLIFIFGSFVLLCMSLFIMVIISLVIVYGTPKLFYK